MKRKGLTIRSRKYRGDMQSGEMMETLGLRSGGHLPPEGLPIRVIDGIEVFVKPAKPKEPGQRKSSKHRVMAICPTCKRVISVGRLHQHTH